MHDTFASSENYFQLLKTRILAESAESQRAPSDQLQTAAENLVPATLHFFLLIVQLKVHESKSKAAVLLIGREW